jgi:hypothetical protein
VQAYAPKADERVDAGGGLMLDKHQVTRGVHRVDFLVHPKDRVVYAVAHYKAGKIVRVVRYVEYQGGLAPDTRLFSRPDGIQFAAPRPRASR